MSNLSKEAQGFVNYMINTFNPSLKELREALGVKLFSQLEAGLERLRTKLFPELKPVLVDLGDSIGKAFGSITKAITDIENIGDLKQVIADAGINIESYARTAGNLYDSFLSVLISAQPLAEKFNKFLEKKTAGWAAYLDAKQATGELEKMFNKAGDIAARIGKIFGNAISGVVNIVRANFTPGGGGYILLDYFEDVTAEFEKFSGSVKGQKALSDYFKGVAENSKAVLTTLGKFIKEILKAGADPNIKTFWVTLGEAAPILGDILRELNASAPSFAEFLVAFAKFTKVTLSSGAITVFWKTLTTALTAVTKVLEDPETKKFFDRAAQILAFFSAVGLLATIVSFAGKVIAGSFLSIAKVLGFVLNPIGALRTALAPLIPILAGISAPVLLGVAAVAAIVAVFILAYNNSEKLRKAISDMAGVLKDVLSGALTRIKESFTDAMGNTEDLRASFQRIGDFIARNIVPIFKYVLSGAIGVVGGAIQAVIYAIGAIRKAFEAFYNFFKGIWKLFNGDFKGAGEAFKDAFISAINFVRNALKTILSPFAGALNGIIDAINSSLGNFSFTIPSWVPKYAGSKVGFPKIPNVDVTKFAKGGTVFPSVGGTLAQIAEAGRPERIEPLDPDGLSKRDKAMIEMLSGGKGEMTINVYPSKGMNESELANMVSRQIAFQLRRGGA
jgi:phage-related minor tail protein